MDVGSGLATPLFMRGLWCVAQWTQSSQTYTQTGQAFFYNNGTFTFNFLDNPSLTWINHFVAINNTDGSGDTYQLLTVTTQGKSEIVHSIMPMCFVQDLRSISIRRNAIGDVASAMVISSPVGNRTAPVRRRLKTTQHR